MRRRGPALTLLSGLVLGGLLLGLSVNAARRDAADRVATQVVPEAPQTSTPASTTPPVTEPVPAPPTTWAGRVDGGGATLAIATEDGVAVAYVCDGRRVEAWLRGTAVDGRLELTGPGGAGLDGGYGDGVATGTVTARGREWTFELGAVRKPSGLYRATATVRNARVTGGWIVLPDGRQVGVLTEDGVPRPAPELDVTTGRVDGSPVRATAVDAAGNGS